jgi:hypothetical protein
MDVKVTKKFLLINKQKENYLTGHKISHKRWNETMTLVAKLFKGMCNLMGIT